MNAVIALALIGALWVALNRTLLASTRDSVAKVFTWHDVPDNRPTPRWRSLV